MDRIEEDDVGHDGALRPGGLMDPVLYGRRVRALRIMHGYERVTDMTEALHRKTGVSVSDRTAYAIERGEQLPGIDFYMAVILLLHPPGGIRYFLTAMRQEYVDEYLKASWGDEK